MPIMIIFLFQLLINEIGFNIEAFFEGKSISEIPINEVDAYHTIFITRNGRGQMYVSAVVDLKHMKFKMKESQQVMPENMQIWAGSCAILTM